MASLEKYINGRTCEILGLGVSNLPLVEKLLDMGLSLTVRDGKSIDKLGDRAEELSEKGVRFITGEGCFDSIEGELVFRSPGIRPDRDGIASAVANGAELTSEIELFLDLTEAQTYGITGSDGKTTTTTLTGLFLDGEAKKRGSGEVFVGGNIGEPLLYRLESIGENDCAVIELSSFQLMTLKKAPIYSAITNVSENHLDWHRGMCEYEWAKKKIVGDNTRRFVTNANCMATFNIAKEVAKRENRPEIYLFSSSKQSFSEIFDDIAAKEGDRAFYINGDDIVCSDGVKEEKLLSISKIKLPGIHNIENYMTAMALTNGSVGYDVYADIAESFGGVKHRLELVRTLDEVDYYNSSIDSSPTRTLAALSALSGRDIVIICGGYDKKLDYSPLAEKLCESVRAVVLTGATAEKIERALLECPHYNGYPEYCRVDGFEAAVIEARRMAKRGGCVLLSPASASFDAFPNFMVRGDRFCEIVNGFDGDKN